VRVLRFYADEANLLETDERSYFLHRDRAGTCVLIRATCPHRGGPLFLGSLEDSGEKSIRCPWHDTVVSVAAMQRKAPPMVVNRAECRVVVREAGESHLRRVRTLLREYATDAACHAASS
jgi:nitrite reductase/ring-hydroxylating ferredoxin subunit